MTKEDERPKKKVQEGLKLSDDLTVAQITLDIDDLRFREWFFDEMMSYLFKEELKIGPKVSVLFLLQLKKFMQNPEQKELELKTKKSFFLGTGEKIDLFRVLTLTRQEKGILLTFSGRPPSKGREGEVKTFINLNPIPGTIGADNRMDFRKTLRFPEVKPRDRILRVLSKIDGEFGVTYDGRLLSRKPVYDYPLEVGEGVQKENFLDEKGKIIGYDLVAKMEGVILSLKNEKEEIIHLSVTDEVVIDEVDFSTGDLGCVDGEVFSVKVTVKGRMKPGFTINSKKDVFAGESEGGILMSEKNVTAGNLHAGTKALAEGILTCENVSRSELEAGESMTIGGDVNDSIIKTPELNFSKRKDGRPNSLSNFRGNIERATLKGVLFSNKNFISLGGKLFSRKNEIAEEIPKREQETADASAKKTEKLTEIKSLILRVFEKIDAKEKGAFLEIINSKKLSGLDKFKNMSNLSDIEKIKKTHAEMVKVAHEAEDKEKELESLKRETESIDKKLSEMSLRISNSTLKSTGQLMITVNGQKKLIEVEKEDRNAQLDLRITYNMRDDLICIEDKSINAKIRNASSL